MINKDTIAAALQDLMERFGEGHGGKPNTIFAGTEAHGILATMEPPEYSMRLLLFDRAPPGRIGVSLGMCSECVTLEK